MADLPVPMDPETEDEWGQTLNEWLTTEHNPDGTHSLAVADIQGLPDALDGKAAKAATEAAIGRVDPGTAGSYGQALVQGPTDPDYVPTRLSAWAYGVRPTESGTNNATRLQEIFTDYAADVAGSAYPPLVALGHGSHNFNGATINIPTGASLIGMSNAQNPKWVGSLLTDVALTVGTPGTYAHGTRLEHFKLVGSPSHGIEWVGMFGELSTIDNVASESATGDGIRISGGGTPCRLGAVSVHSNDGAGLHFVNMRTTTSALNVSGDANGDALVKVSGSQQSNLFSFLAIKAEQSSNGVVSLIDLDGAVVWIGQLRTLGGSIGGAAMAQPVIRQSRTNDGYLPAPVTVQQAGIFLPENWTAGGYVDAITGVSVSAADLNRHGISTHPTLSLSPTHGAVSTAPPVTLTATVGTTQTTIPHELPITPVVDAIIPHSNATIWRSAAPDATNIYLTASESTDATITLRRGTAVSAFDTQLIYDTFTAADGTNIAVHTPDVGTAWAVSGSWSVQGNRAVPAGPFTRITKPTGATDARLSGTFNFGADGAARALGFTFRWQDTQNYWLVLAKRIGTATAVDLMKREANVLATVRSEPFRPAIAASTDFTMTATLRGRELRVFVNGALALSTSITTLAAAATEHGFYAYSIGSGIQFDNLEVRIP